MHDQNPGDDGLLFIEEGVTRPFVIPAEEGIHGTLCGERKIATDEDVQSHVALCERYKAKNATGSASRQRHKFIAEYVTGWNVVSKGEAVEPTADNVARLPPQLLWKLEGVVSGIENDGAERDADLLEKLRGK